MGNCSGDAAIFVRAAWAAPRNSDPKPGGVPRTNAWPYATPPRRGRGALVRLPRSEIAQEIRSDFVPGAPAVARPLGLRDPSVELARPRSRPSWVLGTLDAVDQLSREAQTICRIEL